MIALFALLAAVTVSILVSRIATQALRLTGLSHEAARFQARSALTGTGFTTQEAERVVDHPVRRRILMVLMVLQSAGLVTIVSTSVLSFVDTDNTRDLLLRGTILLVGLTCLWLLARSRWVEGVLSRVIDWTLERFSDLEVSDFVKLLGLEDGYTIASMRVTADSWLEGRTLVELDLPDEGVLVLGIQKEDGSYLGAPRGRYPVQRGDTLVLYGLSHRLSQIKSRGQGEQGSRARKVAEREHTEELIRQDEEEGKSKHSRRSEEAGTERLERSDRS